MNTFLRARNIAPMMRRNLSSHSHDHKKDVDTWKRYSYVMGAGCVLLTIADVWYIYTHDHPPHTPKEVPYMHVRAKPFPWSKSDCDLFDGACWKGEQDHHH